MTDLTVPVHDDWAQYSRVILEQVPRPRPTPEIGIQVHALWESYWAAGEPTPQLLAILDSIAALGIRHIRIDFGWSAAQPTVEWEPVTNYYCKRFERLLTEAASRNLGVLATIQQSPAWARPGTGSSTKQYPTDLTAWQTFLTNMDTRWGHRVDGWQIWNEPNISAFTGLTDRYARADKYAAVLQKAAQLTAPVIFGGPSQTDGQFIDDLYWRNTKPNFDIMSWHPYLGDQSKSPLSTDLYDKSRPTFMPSVLEHMAYHRDGLRAIWWTEVGVSVHSNDGITNAWEKGQPTDAAATTSIAEYIALAQSYRQVERVYLYAAHIPNPPNLHMAGYSLLKDDGTPKAQLLWVSEFLGGL